MFTLNVWVQRKYTDERKWGPFGGLMSIINNLHAGMLAGAKHEIATPASLFNISRTMFFVIYKPILRSISNNWIRVRLRPNPT